MSDFYSQKEAEALLGTWWTNRTHNLLARGAKAEVVGMVKAGPNQWILALRAPQSDPHLNSVGYLGFARGDMTRLERNQADAPRALTTVGDLLEVLARLDPRLPVATHANNHTYMAGPDAVTHGALRVALLQTHSGPHVVIGNVSKRNINAPNWYVTEELDGGRPIPQEW